MICNVVLAIGEHRFRTELFRYFVETVSARQMVVHAYDDPTPVECLMDEHHDDDRAVTGLAARYAGGLYRYDPLRRHFSRSAAREIIVADFSVDQISHPHYRKTLYLDTGMAGKFSIVLKMPKWVVSISAYRGADGGPFDAADRAAVMPHVETLAAAMERHLSLTMRPSVAPDVDQLADILLEMRARKRLSRREALVCAYVVCGYTNEAIALNINISQHSVSTYRRRAYEKLGVTSQSELFGRVLSRFGGAPAAHAYH